MIIIATDLAFRRHSSAAVVLSVEDRVLSVLEVEEWRPSRDRPLVPSKVIREMIAMGDAHDAEKFAGDVHYIDTALEYVRESSMGWLDIDNSPTGKENAYTNFRVWLREQRVRLPHPDSSEASSELIRQLRDTKMKPLPGGGFRVVPARGSGHGDLVSALVGGASLLTSEMGPPNDGLEAGARSVVDEGAPWADPWDDDDDDESGDSLLDSPVMRRFE